VASIYIGRAVANDGGFGPRRVAVLLEQDGDRPCQAVAAASLARVAGNKGGVGTALEGAATADSRGHCPCEGGGQADNGYYPSDVVAGRVLGLATARAPLADPAFCAEFAQVREEFDAARKERAGQTKSDEDRKHRGVPRPAELLEAK